MIKANISWSCKQITKMFNNGVLKFDNIIQRSYVWENKRKSDLIHSLIEGFPVPPFYARKVDGKYDFLDGKQRMNAIAGFINGDYYLEGLPEITYTNENGEQVTEDLNDVKFEDLPESVQDAIKDYTLTIYYYEDITDEQIRELFRKLNNGKPLSAKEKNIANMIDIANITELGKHELFERMLSEKAVDARKQLPIVMKMWAMLNKDIKEVSFDSKAFNELVSTVETTEEERSELVDVMNYYLEAVNLVPERVTVDRHALKKMVNETNVVSLTPFVSAAIYDGISTELFADWLGELFTKEKTVSYEYQNACTAGAAKSVNVVKRNEELKNAWAKFFNTDNSSDDNEDSADGSDETIDDTEDTEDAEDAEDTKDTDDIDSVDNNVNTDNTSENNENAEYVYGMRARGFAPLCQPMNGLIERRDSNTTDYYDLIVYNRELTDEEIRDFQLDKVAC